MRNAREYSIRPGACTGYRSSVHPFIRSHVRLPFERIFRGDALFAKRDFDTALADYERALKLNPNDASAYNERARFRRERSRTDAAREDYQKALEVATPW
ncbi:MAG: tetratricopeptide repeat protein [Planctomycetes bacterium]|nr:tetratricopeptide repeat protein [Planctomycetota bacterium]